MLFNQRIRELRIECNETQAKVAVAIGMAIRNYQRLEAQDNTPNYKTLLALADHFGVSIDYLVGRTDKREINR